MNDPKSHEPEDPLLLDHEADGIRELDNDLPRWWVWLFYITIAFSVAYMLYYHVLGIGDLQAAAYAREMERGDAIKAQALARFEAEVGSMQPLNDPEVLRRGQQTYATLCAPCHRDDGGGLVGPNLTDDYWIHGGEFTDTLRVIWDGVPDKGMVAWKGVLQPAEIHAVASYAYTLRGTDPPNPKPREDQAPADTGESEWE
ncbi:MAG: c-type cytochrome [Verrucomicrobiae bacterium]|nr:c-type cytochrome [Verrucomicrobiae bacterium]